MIIITDPLYLLVCATALVALCMSVYLLLRVRALTRGADGASLEDKIRTVLSQNVQHATHLATVDKRLAVIEDRMRRVVRNVKTNRFDPFEGAGSSGKQSFAVALLDEDGNGAVISSLHAHDKVRVFAKPIQSFTSTHELSDEEKKVIADAR